MPNRIKDFANTATTPAADDFLGLDGATNGTRKIAAGTSITKNIAATGNAASGEVVMGNDTRLTDSRTPTDNSVTPAKMSTAAKTSVVGITIDGGTSAITAGVKGYIKVPFACTITSAQLLADQSGSITLDVWKDTLANYPPTVADSICASAKPALSSQTNSNNTTLTGWTTTINADDVLGFNVDANATSVRRVTLQLIVTRN